MWAVVRYYIVHIFPGALTFYGLKEGWVHALVHLVNNNLGSLLFWVWVKMKSHGFLAVLDLDFLTPSLPCIMATPKVSNRQPYWIFTKICMNVKKHYLQGCH